MHVQTAAMTDRRPLIDRIGAGFTMIFETLARTSRGARCAREAERLSALSDAQLARMGLKREDIIRHAFEPFINA